MQRSLICALPGAGWGSQPCVPQGSVVAPGNLRPGRASWSLHKGHGTGCPFGHTCTYLPAFDNFPEHHFNRVSQHGRFGLFSSIFDASWRMQFYFRLLLYNPTRQRNVLVISKVFPLNHFPICIFLSIVTWIFFYEMGCIILLRQC